MLQWDMARETVEIWRCEYPNCRHAWIAQSEEAPRRCARCKKCNWHKTLTAKETIRKTNWQEQLLESVKPFMKEQIKAGIAHEILEAKRRKGEYVAEVVKPEPLPQLGNAGSISGQRCNHRQPDYETGRAGYCGKMAGHKLSHGAWILGEELDV